jgi:sugar transferase (PEP-CTERM system associated)
MIRIFKHYVPRSLLLLGAVEFLLLAGSAYVGSTIGWYRTGEFQAWRPGYLGDMAVFAAAMTGVMVALGMYHRKHCRTLYETAVRLMVVIVVVAVGMAAVFYALPLVSIWRSSIAISFVVAFLVIVAARALYLRLTGFSRWKRRILVLGVGRQAARIEALEREGPNRDFQVVGFVAPGGEDRHVWTGPIFAGVNSLRLFVKEHGVDEIVVALQERRGQLDVNELLACKMDGVDVTDYATFWERETGRVDLDSLNPSWLIFSDGFPGGYLQAVAKRVFDIVASLALLTFSFPLLLLVSAAVKLDSRGPVFYRQERVGLNGRVFMLLKFRSMREDAEQDGVPRWANLDDSRITRVGSILRKTRIDETPQLINVLKGEMSIVGPRPERAFFVEELRAKIPFYFERHRVKPGISGWAQLNYPYGASVEDARAKFQYDLYYLKNYSIFLDFIVLLQTARVVLWSEGAR